jgi:hypothetical protein
LLLEVHHHIHITEPIAPLFQLYVYGGVPPVTTIVICPSHDPLQVGLLINMAGVTGARLLGELTKQLTVTH